MSKNDGLIGMILKFSISTWINFIVGIGSSFFVTRLVTPEINGMYNIFNTTVTLIMYVCTLGLDASLFRFYNEPPKNETSKVFSFKLMVASVSITVLISLTTILGFSEKFSMNFFGFNSFNITVITFLVVIGNVIMRYLNIICRLTYNVKQYTLQTTLLQLAIRLAIFSTVFIKSDIIVAVTTQLICLIILVGVYLYVQRKVFIPDKNEFKKEYKTLSDNKYLDVIKFALYSSPVYILINLNLFFSQQIIRLNIDAYALGIFSAASYFVTLLSLFNGGFSNFWAGYVYENYNNQKDKISSMHDYLTFFISMLFFGMIFFKDIIYYFLGVEYRSSKVFVALVLLPSVLEIIAQTTIYGINLRQKNYILLINHFIYTIINLSLACLLVNNLKLLGVAFSMAVSSIVLFVINTYYGQKYYLTIKNKFKTFLAITCLSLVSIFDGFSKNFFASRMLILIVVILFIFMYKKEIMLIFSKIKKMLFLKK